MASSPVVLTVTISVVAAEEAGDFVRLPERERAAASTDANHRSPKIFLMVRRSASRSGSSTGSLSCRIG